MNNQRVVPVFVDELDQPVAFYVTPGLKEKQHPEQHWNDKVGGFCRQYSQLGTAQLEKIIQDKNSPEAATLAAHLCLTNGSVGQCLGSGRTPISHL
jgi:hypothetical protein